MPSLLSRVSARIDRYVKAHRVFTEYEVLVNNHRGRIEPGDRILFLVMTPKYWNLGDHLIAYEERFLLKEAFPDMPVVEIPYEECGSLGSLFSRLLKPRDIVFVTGGGYMGDLWPGLQQTLATILLSASKNKIFFFPQSVYFKNEAGIPSFQRVINSLQDAFFLARERRTYNFIRSFLRPDIVQLLPDVGLLADELTPYRASGVNPSNKAILCLRNDKESIQSESFNSVMKSTLEAFGLTVVEIDTHRQGVELGMADRETVLSNFVMTMSGARIVITNRLHGMIFAALAGVSCLALDNISGKVSGVYEWVRNVGSIAVCSEEKVIEQLTSLLNSPIVAYNPASLLEQKKLLINLLRQEAGDE